jgi:hypothetical protein
MLIPQWFTFSIAGFVIVFGIYRLYIAARADPETLAARKGLYGRSRKAHALYGVLYLLLGAFIIAGAFGYSPFR